MSTPLPLHAGADLHGLGLVVAAWATGGAALLLVAYVRGLRRALAGPRARTHRWRATALAAGLLLTVAVTAPPVGDVLEQRLSTHMVQHLVLMLVAAALLAVAQPGRLVMAGLPASLRSPLARLLRAVPGLGLLAPHVAWSLSVAGLWLWHLPLAYDAAVRSGVLHLAEHATFLLTSWLFWWQLVRAGRSRLRGAAAAAYVLAAVPPGAALGAVLTFADHPLYAAQAAHAARAGADPLTDQHLAGIVMWVPLDLLYLALGIWLFGRWFSRLGGPAPDETVLPPDSRSSRPRAPVPVEVLR